MLNLKSPPPFVCPFFFSFLQEFGFTGFSSTGTNPNKNTKRFSIVLTLGGQETSFSRWCCSHLSRRQCPFAELMSWFCGLNFWWYTCVDKNSCKVEANAFPVFFWFAMELHVLTIWIYKNIHLICFGSFVSTLFYALSWCISYHPRENSPIKYHCFFFFPERAWPFVSTTTQLKSRGQVGQAK